MSLSQQRMATVQIVMETVDKYISPDDRATARKELHEALEREERLLFIPIPERDPAEVLQTARETEAAFAARVTGDGL